jgi:uncharacterized membrane protein
MSTYLIVKTLHILSSVLLVGTGLGSAFYLFFANRSGSIAAQAVVSRHVVLADWLFTTPTIIIQPVTGVLLAHWAGWSLSTPWIAWSIALYLIAGACWLPVVWLQIRLKQMAAEAFARDKPLPERYWRFARYWEWLGYPAFLAMIAIYYLMVVKPPL